MNLAGAAFSAYPSTGSFARSAVASSAGARFLVLHPVPCSPCADRPPQREHVTNATHASFYVLKLIHGGLDSLLILLQLLRTHAAINDATFCGCRRCELL